MSNELVAMNDLERMAAAVAKSGLFGVKTPEQALAIMLVAQSEQMHPMSAVQEFDIIQGRPARKSWAMLARFQRAGGSVQWHQRDDALASATFSHPQGGTVKIDWDMARAKKAGLAGKEMWAKYPRNMLSARVISEGVRTVFPGATGGFYTPEEERDMVDVTPPKQQLVKPEHSGQSRAKAEKTPPHDPSTGEILPADDPFANVQTDHVGGEAAQPDLMPQKTPEKIREEAEASGNHVLQRIKGFATAPEVAKYVERYKPTIVALPKDISDMVFDMAAERIKELTNV